MMASFMSITVMSVLSYVSYRLLDHFRFPASRLVGPILAIAIAQFFGFVFWMPAIVKTACSIVFGVYLGLRFTQSAMKDLKAILIASFTVSLIYVFLTLQNGWFLERMSGLDPYTSFLAVIPGGVAEAGILAVTYGADLSKVTVFQLARFLSIVTLVPMLVKWGIEPYLYKRYPSLRKPLDDASAVHIVTERSEVHRPDLHWIWLFVTGTLGSFSFNCIHFPAALLLGATFVTAILNLQSFRTFQSPDLKYYDLAQIIMGAIIGMSFTHESVIAMGQVMVPLLAITFWMILSSMMIAWIFTRLFKLDFMTGFFGVLPGGLSTMIVLAEAYDCNMVIISSLQLVRLITAVMVIPILYQMLLH